MIDLDYNKALSGLRDSYWLKEQCHISFRKKSGFLSSVVVDVHWDLDFKRGKTLPLPKLWLRLRDKEVNGNRVRYLSIEDTIFSLVLHKRRFGNILSLKEACDLAIILNKYNSEIDWDYILKWARLCRMESALYFSLSQSNLLDNILASHSIPEQLKVPFWKRKVINSFILKNTFFEDMDLKNIYLKAHFLLYDSLWEPVEYILNIPQEQFAKFYNLTPYTTKTNLLYRLRYLYFLRNLFAIILFRKMRLRVSGISLA